MSSTKRNHPFDSGNECKSKKQGDEEISENKNNNNNKLSNSSFSSLDQPQKTENDTSSKKQDDDGEGISLTENGETSAKKRKHSNNSNNDNYRGKSKKRNQKSKWKSNEDGEKFKKEVNPNFRRVDEGPRTLEPPHQGSYASSQMKELFGEPSYPKNTTATTSTSETATAAPQEEGRSKKKVALLIGFLGTNYTGMQINHRQRTIQAEVEWALYRSQCIHEQNVGYPQKYSWSNSARTDKGVHAAAQVCSVKLELPPIKKNTMDHVRQTINQHLPHDIQILDIIRTTRSFSAKTTRDRVRYRYMLPTFMLCHSSQLRQWFDSHPQPIHNANYEECIHQTNKHHDNDSQKETDTSDTTSLSLPPSPPPPPTLDPETIQRFRDVLSCFVGTHSFHNYTNGKQPEDPSCVRFISSFDIVQEEEENNNNNNGWITVEVVGQSFLMHQIRKMMYVAMDMTRKGGGGGGDDNVSTNLGNTHGLDFVRETLSRQCHINLGIAPAQGLFLDMSYFDRYNHKVRREQQRQQQQQKSKKKKYQKKPTEQNNEDDNNNDDEHNHMALNWAEPKDINKDDDKDISPSSSSSSSSSAHQRWKEFRNHILIRHIMDEEERQGNFKRNVYEQEFVPNVKNKRYRTGGKSSGDGGGGGGDGDGGDSE